GLPCLPSFPTRRSSDLFDVPGEYDVLGVIRVAVRPVHPTQHDLYLGYAMGYCREQGRPGELKAMQVFWPDKQGRFPFTRDCDTRSEEHTSELQSPDHLV